MGQTSSSSPPPKEDPDLTSSFGTNLQNFKMKTKILSQELIAFIQSSLENGNLQETVSAISSALGDIEKAPLNIAVMGETGAGKSSLINALQRVGADKGGAAASTGVEFTTTERTPHAYTKFPSVTLWDLPGIGSTGFQSHDYLKKIKVEEYDFFIIVFSRRLKYNDTELVKAIVQTNRSFYYVQTKIDLDLMVEKQCKPRIFNKENILEQIRNNISNIVKEVTHQEPPVFLVSNFDVSDFDFPKLESTLLSELPAYKHHIFMLTLPSVIDATIDQKKNMLKRKLWKVSTMLSILANKEFRELTHNNMEMLERTLNDCRSSFGLDKASLRNIAEDLNVTLEELRANIKSPHLFSDEPDTSFTDKLLKHIRHSNFSNVSHLQNNFIDILASDVKIILSEEVLLKEKYHLHFLGMGQTSSSTTPPKEDPDLTSNFGKNLQNFKMKTKILSQELIAFIESSLEHGNLRETVSAISKSLGDIEKTPLNIAVMGESGTGKSSLINALRGVGVDEEGAAATGVICTTTERTPYSCAKFPSVTLWDLPGIVSFDFQSHDYLKKIKFEEYDLFIIVSCRRLTQNVTELVKAIVKMNRSFYFVQTNIDLDLMNEEKCKPKTFDKENTLKKILNPISRALKEVTQQEPPVFLVSNFDVSDFDFPKLEATLLSKLPVYKRHKFMHALQIVTDSTIDQKRDMLKQKIWKESIMPRAWATIPFRRLNQNDIEMLEQTLNDYRSSFGLDEASLGNIAKDLNMTLEELKENIESPHLLSDEPDTALTEKLMKYIRNPYFSKIVHLQNYFVDTVASDVKIILSKEELFTEKHPPLHRAICKPSSSTPSSLTVQLLAFGFENFLKNFKKESSILSKETITLIESHLEGENLQGALSTITHALRKIDKAPLNIAVTGETGTGKSSFINALRGVRDEEEGAAKTGVVETTMQRTPYPHPKLPNVTIWDLPGIGTTTFPPQNYLTEMKFGEYDFFIIISATRFKDTEALLAKVIEKMNTKFYFVRTKIDQDVSNEQRSKPKSFNRDSVLKKIKDECSGNLQKVLSSQPPVFLVSNFDVSDFDFPKLETTLLSELPAHKRHIFMMSLHSVTETAIDRKRDSLRQKIWLEALKEGLWAIIPLGGFIRDEIQKLEKTLNLYRSYFGLDEASLENIAKDFNVSVNEIKAHLKSLHLLTKSKDMSFKEKLLKYIEYISYVTGGPLASGLYFRKTYYWKSLFIDTLASDAKSLLNKEEFLSEKPGSCMPDLPEYWERGMEL